MLRTTPYSTTRQVWRRIIADQVADADAFAKGTSIGGLFAAGKSQASILVTPAVKADVDSSTIVAVDSVNVRANFGDGNGPSVTALDTLEADAMDADEISTAYAKGSGGALVGLINARAAGAAVIVSSNSTGELHSDSNVKLRSGSTIDATTTTIESLQGTGSELKMEVESTTDKDGVFGNPASLVTIRQDSQL